MSFGRTACASCLAASLLLSTPAALAQDEPAPAPAADERAALPPAASAPPAPPDATEPPASASSPTLTTTPPSTPARFGDAGELVVTVDSSIAISSTQYSVYDAKYFYAVFSPGLDYFIVRGVSLGLDVGASYGNVQGYSAGGIVKSVTTTLSAGARVGVNVPLSDAFSLYPRLTLGAESITREITFPAQSLPLAPTISVNPDPAVAPLTKTTGGAYVTAFVPLLFHPAPHFFLGAGPGVFHELGSAHGDPGLGGPRTTVFGRLVVGGWWGGDEPFPSSGSSSQPVAPAVLEPRFGDRNQWVFSGDLFGGVGYTKFTGSSASTTSVQLSPAVDYFPIARLSVGLGGLVGHSTATGATDNGVIQSTRVGGEARIGVDLPISSSFSFYPRASLGVAHDIYTRNDPTLPANQKRIEVYAALYAPLLAHIASHFFAGFGPVVVHDLVNNDQTPNAVDNLATRLGASLIVGGWL